MPCGIEVDSKATILRTVDIIVSFVLITPLTLIWWSGTWKLLDFYLYPEDQWTSWWISFVVGNIVCIICWYVNPLIARGVTSWNWVVRFSVIFVFNYIASLFSLNIWRGLWEMIDKLLEDKSNGQSISLAILVAGELLLLFLRSNANNVPCPFGVNTEVGCTFQIAVPRFRSKISDIWWYTADVLVTMFLINTAVILVWRTVWELITSTISPDFYLDKQIICAFAGFAASALLLTVNYAIYLSAKFLSEVHWLLVYVFEAFVNSCACVAGLLLWVSCWQMLEEKVIGPDKWQAWVFHVVGFVALSLLQASTSIAGMWCGVDGDLTDGDSLWWNIDYATAWYTWRHGRRELIQLPVGVDVADCTPIMEDAGVDVSEYNFGDDYDPIGQLVDDVIEEISTQNTEAVLA